MFINNRKSQNSRSLYVPNLGPLLHPLDGIKWCSVLRLFVFLCIDFKKIRFVFSTLQSGSCFQLTISFLLGVREGSLLWIDIISFLLPIGKFLKWFGKYLYCIMCISCADFYSLFSFCSPILVLISCIHCFFCEYVFGPDLRSVLVYVEDCNQWELLFFG